MSFNGGYRRLTASASCAVATLTAARLMPIRQLNDPPDFDKQKSTQCQTIFQAKKNRGQFSNFTHTIGNRAVSFLKCETSYLENAEIKQDGNPDESAGPAEADETLG